MVKKILFLILRKLATLYTKKKVATYGEGLKVNYPSIFTNKTYIGKDCHFNGISVVGSGTLIIGDHFHSGSNILVITSNHNYESKISLPYDEFEIEGNVEIGNYVWLGSRTIVLPKTKIEDGVILQAGSVAHGLLKEGGIYGGNPVKLIKYRDMANYQRLKKLRKAVLWNDKKNSNY